MAEEYGGGWLKWAQRFAPGITLVQFAVINAPFLLMCIVGAMVAARRPVFSLSVAALLFVNALIHLLPVVHFRHYLPGMVSAAPLYLPLAVGTYLLFARAGLTLRQGVAASLLGLAWMVVPLMFQAPGSG